jgi:hypothetical protein
MFLLGEFGSVLYLYNPARGETYQGRMDDEGKAKLEKAKPGLEAIYEWALSSGPRGSTWA